MEIETIDIEIGGSETGEGGHRGHKMITNKLGILNLLFFMLQLGLIRGDCDCQQLSDEVENLRIIVQIHTEKLANLVNYERKTGRLFQWFQTFNHNEGETPQNGPCSVHNLVKWARGR